MFYVITLILSVLFDQLTKWHIVGNFKLHESHWVIDNFLSITYRTNTGGAFSVFSNYPVFFKILAFSLVLAGILATLKISKLPAIWQISLGFIIGGAAGNLVDRLRVGKVTDFIDFTFWPTFNVADISISIGVALLVIIMFMPEKKEESGGETSEEIGEKENSLNLKDTGEPVISINENI